MPMPLPIQSIRPQVDECLSSPEPLVVVAPTGSGKSTCLPVWMSESFDGPVLVIEPRRVACQSLATYVAGTMGEPVGQRVGYRIRFANRSSAATRILFVTPGVALRMIGGGPLPFEAVLFDEFHERGWEVDLCLTLLRARNQPNTGSPKIVVTSATLDAEVLAAALGATLLTAEGRTFPVSVSYVETDAPPTLRDLDRRVSDAVAGVLRAPHDDGGDILVFLPGKREISACDRALRRRLGNRPDIVLMSVHGQLPTDRVARALADHSGARRVFLATNVAETSLTIPRVTTVIDTGLVRMRAHRAGRSGLVTLPVSKASMDQRAGRAGRVARGEAVRLWSARFVPVPDRPPEVMCIELDDVVLRATVAGLGSDAIGRAPWVTPPPEFALERAISRLKALGALTSAGRASDLGRSLLELPVSLHEARILVDPPPELTPTLCDLVGVLQARADILRPLDVLPAENRADVELERVRLLKAGRDEVSDALVCLRHGQPREHGLHSSALKEARAISSALRRVLGCPCGSPTRDPSPLPARGALSTFLLRRWPEAAFALRPRADGAGRGTPGGKRRRGGEPWANGVVELGVYPYARWGRDKPGDGHWPKAGLIMQHEWIEDGGTGIVGVGSMLLPCTFHELAGARLGEERVGTVRVAWTRDRCPVVTGEVSQVLGGAVLQSLERQLEGAVLRKAVAELILEGRWLASAGEGVCDDLHVARTLRDWPGQCPGSLLRLDAWLASPNVFLEDRLAQLGVEQCEDLALVDGDDLRLDVTSELGAPIGREDEVRAAFPRAWGYQGAQYACTVDPRRREVMLTPQGASAKRLKEPPRWALPGFEGFKVRYRQASRVVTLRD
ncbi:MAG: ATP-dependent RNA helicase [Lentisphaerae bacterium]|jgi:ATP-dependent helicase HrpB|nr:ATP-dependent RNA helicase [Lentisphaerota bacterium]MBT4822831.1 ATP-dependent RNA helicase [Lentisphaerota bacterium]MBT5605612.1 ATP-dependent RNA helicase [Lentisphaerota bacterium]MBT7053802.1 ATP-dependent RNA helicase [Lentisphaerota bacterium]MBT7847181.1 ATP-dependent RNA helicase [Lentisphaerota bacterium]